MNLVDKQGIIYIKNNGQKDNLIKTRAFGAYNEGKIYVSGRKLTRTWSLLAERGFFGMTSVSLLHNPQDMVTIYIWLLISSQSTIRRILCFAHKGLESWR